MVVFVSGGRNRRLALARACRGWRLGTKCRFSCRPIVPVIVRGKQAHRAVRGLLPQLKSLLIRFRVASDVIHWWGWTGRLPSWSETWGTFVLVQDEQSPRTTSVLSDYCRRKSLDKNVLGFVCPARNERHACSVSERWWCVYVVIPVGRSNPTVLLRR